LQDVIQHAIRIVSVNANPAEYTRKTNSSQGYLLSNLAPAWEKALSLVLKLLVLKLKEDLARYQHLLVSV
jgi:hypothetical protein